MAPYIRSLLPYIRSLLPHLRSLLPHIRRRHAQVGTRPRQGLFRHKTKRKDENAAALAHRQHPRRLYSRCHRIACLATAAAMRLHVHRGAPRTPRTQRQSRASGCHSPNARNLHPRCGLPPRVFCQEGDVHLLAGLFTPVE